MAHKKLKVSIPIGGSVVCGSRKLTLDAVDGNGVDVTLSIKKYETVETRDPRQRDNPWILEDPGEGTMVDVKHSVTLGHKIRVGNHRQFRVLPAADDGTYPVVVVGPESEVS